MVSMVIATLLALPLFFVSFWAFAVLVLLATLIAIGILVHSVYDAYKTAEKINKGEVEFTRKSRLFWLPVSMYIIIIATIAFISIIGPISPAEGHMDDIQVTTPQVTTPQITSSAASDTTEKGIGSLLIQKEDLPAD